MNDYNDEMLISVLKDMFVTKNKDWEVIELNKNYKITNGPLGKNNIYQLPQEFKKPFKLQE